MPGNRIDWKEIEKQMKQFLRKDLGESTLETGLTEASDEYDCKYGFPRSPKYRTEARQMFTKLYRNKRRYQSIKRKIIGLAKK